MAMMDRTRARRLMAERGLDAVIAYGGANFFYATGFQNYFDNPAASVAVLAADAALPDFAIVANWVADAAAQAADVADILSFPLWLEIGEIEAYRAGTLQRQPKPTRYDVDSNIRLLAGALQERGLGRGRIGIELAAVSTVVHAMLRRHLPEIEWVDAADLFFELRLIKTPYEIDCIRTATRFAEHGLRTLAQTPLHGHDANGLKLIYERALAELALREPQSGFQGIRVTASVGGIISPTLSGGPKVQPDDLIFFDCGASVHGYGSDTGRTICLRPPSAEAQHFMDAINAGMEAALGLVKPGARMCDIFATGQEAVRRCRGMDWYTRGHIGHAMGLGMAEMPPFLAPAETRPLEPGMVIALETPLYMRGLGGFQVEECFLVTQDGYELLTTLPRDFLRSLEHFPRRLARE
jgi:Xaa-Pro dipeptidase